MKHEHTRSNATSKPDSTPRKVIVRNALAGLLAAGMLSLATIVSASASDGGISSGGDDTGTRGGDRYEREWDSFTLKDKRWARSTSQCESGQDPRIHNSGGEYHGAFQFLRSTWKTSPMSPGGDPHKFNWKTQAVVAIKLKHRDSWRHWPVCGR